MEVYKSDTISSGLDRSESVCAGVEVEDRFGSAGLSKIHYFH